MKMKKTATLKIRINFKTVCRLLLFAAISIFVSVGMALGTEEKTALQMDLPPPDVPQPQQFC